MDIDEIVDRNSFEQWLEETEQPRAVCMALANRSAMRVLPIAWGWFQRAPKDDWTALPGLRCCLISSGTNWESIPDEIIVRPSSAADTAAYAADAAAYAAVYVADAADAAAYAADAAAYAAAADAATFTALKADCRAVMASEELSGLSLWPEVPEKIDAIWRDLAKTLRAEAKLANDETAWGGVGALDWTFFVEFYARAWTGEAQDAALIEAIVTSDEIDWDRPAQALDVINRMWRASKVAGIVRDKPYPIRLGIDPGTSKLVSLKFDEIKLEAIVKRLRAALREFLTRCKNDPSQNRMGEQIERSYKSTIKLLRADISKFKTNPMELFDAIERAQEEFRDIATQEGFHREPIVTRLIRDMNGACENICVSEPSVLATERKRSDVRLERYSKAQIQKLVGLGAGMSMDSKGQLKASVVIAMNKLCSVNSDVEERKAAFYLLSAVLPRAADTLSSYLAEDEAGAAKRSSMIEKLANAGDKANKIDKGIDAIQEAVVESGISGDWIAEFYRQAISGNWFS